MTSAVPTAEAEVLRTGTVIPAHPLALTPDRKLDERRQRALTRYYLAAGAGGLAVAVHTTQFAIRAPKIGLLRPVLEITADTMRREASRPIVLVAGVVGDTKQAVTEARQARDLGYHAVLIQLGALRDASDDELIAHCRAVGEVLPLFGFYLQPAVGGRPLSYQFWRRFAEIESAVAIKIAPFDRYRTLEVVRAVADAGRAGDIALYTGNDDHIVLDLITPFRIGEATLRIVGGLLGHWAAWTRCAVELLEQARASSSVSTGGHDMLVRANEVTDMNAALFDPSNAFRGSIAGIHEVLRRQGLLAGRWCLDPSEDLSPGQLEEIDRVYAAYPHLTDDAFVREHLDRWLA